MNRDETSPENNSRSSTVTDGSPKKGSEFAVPSTAARSAPFFVNPSSREAVGKTAPTPHRVSSTAKGNEFDLPGRLFSKTGGGKRDSIGHRGSLPSVVGPPGMNLEESANSTSDKGPLGGKAPRRGSVGMPETAPRELQPLMSSSSPKIIPDAEFFSDMLFMWLGVESTNFFVFNKAINRYESRDGWGSISQREALEAFQECGLLARNLDRLLQNNFTESSFLQQSLRSSIRRQLTMYHYLIASVRERSHPPLSYGDLAVLHKRTQPKLWTMHHVLQETEHVKGGELVSKLQIVVQQGSRRIATLLSDIYIEAVSPLLGMTVDSITKGEVSDPFNEFFIAVNHAVEDGSDSFWTAKFALRPGMLPTTVSNALADDILLVTKNVSFIRRCCRAKQWRMDPAIVDEASKSGFHNLHLVVKHASVYSNTAVMRLLKETFELDVVLRMVNAFLLVGYGDFYELLIEKLNPVLSKLSQTVSVSQVRDIVNSTLLEITPYAKHVAPERFSTLKCEVIKDDAKIGWDAFVMTMSLPSPLNCLFDYVSSKVYRRLFRMMFKVKVAEVALKKSWRRSVELDRSIAELHRSSPETAAWREVAADAHLIGLQLNHFVGNLWSYLVAEVSTVAWDLLMKAVDRCVTFDDLRIAHNAYLAYLTQRSLLHTDCSSIRMNIENILTIGREYCGCQALLVSLVERGAGDVHTVRTQYQRLMDNFQLEISSLLSTLEEQHLQFDFLNFLLLRLNFNRYYRDVNSSNTDF
ncbi:Gamma tubulin complex component N-terminal/Gamma tubulin complex component C-terminal, putative [Angomonas deanei]|uniref:Gamma tubulin complex component N-terminal/Gamma tubulin complex component C-terminal, putative n=1 Tax=Angomonas deanei TaxID=59799 RepID=A0A7G2CIH7_9TRYP|nr:Gamma tubulin complex component N-terminal/Gamma tubulin complex component C-terminal, putative [Angomonas deanei]